MCVSVCVCACVCEGLYLYLPSLLLWKSERVRESRWMLGMVKGEGCVSESGRMADVQGAHEMS